MWAFGEDGAFGEEGCFEVYGFLLFESSHCVSSPESVLYPSVN